MNNIEKKYKNIIFDIGGVLVDFVPEKSFETVGAPKEMIEELLNATVRSDLWPELDLGIIPEDKIIDKMVKNYEAGEKYIRDFFRVGKMQLVTEFEYSSDWLKGMKDRGYNVYLLSNYPKSYFELHYNEMFTFKKYTDGKVVSAYEKLIKPDKRIYELILRRFNLKAEESIFIDDRIENVEGAKAACITAIQFNGYDETRKKLEEMLEERGEI